MSEHSRNPDVAEFAALYLSGAMNTTEREAFESQLAAGNKEYIAGLREMEPAALVLLSAVKPAPPGPSLRESLLCAIDARSQQPEARSEPDHHAPSQIWREWKSDSVGDSDLFTLRADEGAWEETGVAGVQVRRLFIDRTSNRMTAMFRMAPGTSYPEHVHDGPEECYVLEGDLHVGSRLVMHKGDYQRAVVGSEHDEQWTAGGCLLLVTSSLSDELR